MEVGTTWGTTYTYTVGSTYKLDVSQSGRFLGIRVINSTAPFRIKSMDIDYVETGAW
jgi:hypothetical protein